MSKAEEDQGMVRNVPGKGKNKSKGLKISKMWDTERAKKKFSKD